MRRLIVVALGVVALSAPQIRGAEKAAIDQAVERGIKGLLALQSNDGSWPNTPGMAALAGVTLLECDVPADTPAIQKAADFVRNEAIDAGQVYPTATAILFLDRLGDPFDEPLIEALTVRLLYAQDATGGWSYYLTDIPPEERKRLHEYYKKGKPAKKTEPAKEGPRTPNGLTPETQQRLLQFRPRPVDNNNQVDHSNTQFASLAMWVGRRHGVPADRALAMVDAHYRRTQNADGGWGYRLSTIGPGAAESTPAMTCAGVLGLAVAEGMFLSTGRKTGSNLRQSFDPAHDLTLRKALARLSFNVDLPPSVRRGPIPRLKGKDLYFLWSLERIMVAMDMDRLGGKDWYNWGAEIIIANQQADGRWPGDHSAYGADTCFALLFLRKANLAGDLTDLLKRHFVLKATAPSETNPKKPPVDPKDPKKPPVEATPPKPPVEARPTFTQPQSARLAESLVKATREGQGELLNTLRQGKGVEYTEALAGAIPQLSGVSKRKAREVLAERLTRMKADTLSRYLQDDNIEIRRAAALASGTREFKDQVPQLIELLNDADQGVVLAAYTALKAMTGQKLGPTAEAWRAWWKARK